MYKFILVYSYATEGRLEPTQIGAEEAFGGQVLTVACCACHIMSLTKDSALFSRGKGALGKLRYNRDYNDRLMPTQFNLQHFRYDKIVSTAAGEYHLAAHQIFV